MSVNPLQQQILRKAIESSIFSKEILPKTPSSVFDGNKVYEELAGILKRYYQTSNTVITEEAFLTLTQDKLDRMNKDAATQQEYFSAISDLYIVRNSGNDDLIDEKIEKHLKKHMQLDLLKKAAMNLDKDEVMEKMADDWRDIMMLDVSGRNQEIINVLDDTEYKRKALSTLYENTIPTGFPAVDALNSGGLAKGELGIIVAASGTGKTLVLTNLATNYVKLKYNVLFIALEELENRMILKFEQSMLRVSRSQILTGARLNEENFNMYQTVYKKNRDKLGNLFFARYSPNTITPAKVEQLISDVKIRQGIDIDVVLIDYPDLLRNPKATGNEAEDGGRLFEEMRRIAQDFSVAMWTASQMNRTAYNALIRTAEHMEGAHRKKNAAELVLAVNQLPEEYSAGYMRLYADKVRNPPEGPYDRMIGLKVVGSAQTVREYSSEEEKRQHIALLEEADSRAEQSFKGKKREKKGAAPDYGAEINSAINRMRGEGQ